MHPILIFYFAFVALFNLFVWSAFIWATYSFFWPRTKGVVISSGVEYKQGDDAEDIYYLALVYSYKVNGIEYQSEKYLIDGMLKFNNKRLAGNEAVKYSNGDEIEVFFNKIWPKYSVLAKRYPPGLFFFMLLAIALVTSLVRET